MQAVRADPEELGISSILGSDKERARKILYVAERARLVRSCLPSRLEDALPQALEPELGVLFRRHRERNAHMRRDAFVREEADARDGEDALLERSRGDESGGVARRAVLGELQVQEELCRGVAASVDAPR